MACLEARCDDFLLSPACPANPASLLCPANPANPINMVSKSVQVQENSSPRNYTLDFSYCTGRPEKLLKYGLASIVVVGLIGAGYVLFSKNFI